MQGSRGRQPLPHTPAAIAKSLQAGQARTPPTDTEGPRSQPRVPAGLRGSQQSEGHPGTGAPPRPPAGLRRKEPGRSRLRRSRGDRPQARADSEDQASPCSLSPGARIWP